MREFKVRKKMNKKEREEFKRKLLERKVQIGQKLSEVYNESKEMETNIAQDLVDKAETSYTKEFLLSLSDTEREQLNLIDDALKRIERKEFGTCQQCEKDISQKRLKALPWTPYCIECQEKAEEEQNTS
jgi:DnaK suppressor protein